MLHETFLLVFSRNRDTADLLIPLAASTEEANLLFLQVFSVTNISIEVGTDHSAVAEITRKMRFNGDTFIFTYAITVCV